MFTKPENIIAYIFICLFNCICQIAMSVGHLNYALLVSHLFGEKAGKHVAIKLMPCCHHECCKIVDSSVIRSFYIPSREAHLMPANSSCTSYGTSCMSSSKLQSTQTSYNGKWEDHADWTGFLTEKWTRESEEDRQVSPHIRINIPRLYTSRWFPVVDFYLMPKRDHSRPMQLIELLTINLNLLLQSAK